MKTYWLLTVDAKTSSGVELTLFWTGEDWSSNKDKAKTFGFAAEAKQHMRQHGFTALVLPKGN